MIEGRIFIGSLNAVDTFTRDVSVKENLAPFLGLKDMTEFVTEQYNVSGIFRMNKDTDAW